MLRAVVGVVAPFLTKILGSTVDGLFKALSAGLSKKGPGGGLLGVVARVLHGLTTGILDALVDFLKTIYT